MDTIYTHDSPDEHAEFNPRCSSCRRESQKEEARLAFMPEWRRRSLEGRGRFDAVADMTDRVAGR